MPPSRWESLRNRDPEGSLQELRDAYAREKTPSSVMELGVAYLWVRRFQAAWEHYDAANRNEPKYAAAYYAMAGTAKWCLNEAHESVEQWSAGLDCAYADAAGGVELPLLLFFASVMRPDHIDRAEAEDLVARRANEPRASNWPGPVAQFMSGTIDLNDLRRACSVRNEVDAIGRHWLTGFYLGVLARRNGDIGAWSVAMRQASETTDDDFNIEKRVFLSKLWNPEFFLARYESGTP